MDALGFLIGRKWPSGPKVGLMFMGLTLLCWFNEQVSRLVPEMFPFVLNHSVLGFVWGAAIVVAGLLAIATGLGLIFCVPLYAFYRTSNLLQSWLRQRVVEEMLCSGLTGRQILDQLVGFGARWWMTAVLPSAALSFLLFPSFRDTIGLLAFLICFLVGTAMAYLGLCSVAWSSLPGATARLPILGAVLSVQLLPTFFVPMIGSGGGGVRFFSTIIAAALYVIIIGRWTAIYGLENWESLVHLDHRVRRSLRLKSRKGRQLPENPIAARESMRGMDSGDLILRGLTFLGFCGATFLAYQLQAVWIYALLIAPVVLVGSYRGASRMSTIMTEEVESRTLETLRSTPMTSNDFLNGWLFTVVSAQWKEQIPLMMGVAGAIVVMGQGEVLASGLVIVSGLFMVVLPVVAAYLGASIAGQTKTRAQISGQLLVAFMTVLVMAGPQVLASGSNLTSTTSWLTLLLLTAGFCWLLNAGARKSLNRVFLP